MTAVKKKTSLVDKKRISEKNMSLELRRDHLIIGTRETHRETFGIAIMVHVAFHQCGSYNSGLATITTKL